MCWPSGRPRLMAKQTIFALVMYLYQSLETRTLPWTLWGTWLHCSQVWMWPMMHQLSLLGQTISSLTIPSPQDSKLCWRRLDMTLLFSAVTASAGAAPPSFTSVEEPPWWSRHVVTGLVSVSQDTFTCQKLRDSILRHWCQGALMPWWVLVDNRLIVTRVTTFGWLDHHKLFFLALGLLNNLP